MNNSSFLLGHWHVEPSTNSLIKGKAHRVVEPKAMDVLLLLCQTPNEVVSADTIIKICWPNLELGDNPLHKCITQLRKALDDKASSPQYIETIRKRGYRVIANIELGNNNQTQTNEIKWQKGSPFAGLKAFSNEQADVFFGRERQINQLIQRLTHQVKHNTAFTLILGSSGSGKTSLLQAGLIPRLLGKNHISGISVVSEILFDIGDANAESLLTEFASNLLDLEIEDTLVFANMSAEDIAQQLISEPASLIQNCSVLIKAYSKTKDISYPRLFITIDRLEVLLDSPNYPQTLRNQFIEIIDLMARSGAIIVAATCRNDFYPLIVQYPTLMQNKELGAHFDLTAPQATDLIQMINLPALAAGLTWEKDNTSHMPLDEIIANDANNTPDALPLLQYTLNELYMQRTDNILTVSAYKKLGGIEGAIGTQAEALVASLSDNHKHALESIFAKLITVNQDGSNFTSKSALWSDLTTPAQREVTQILVDNRLLISDLEHTKASFRLAHEALIKSWSRIQNWTADHKESLLIKTKLNHASQQWLKENEHSAYLLVKGKPLNEALSLQSNANIELTPQEKRFINASKQKANKQNTIKRATVSILAILTLASTLLAALSFNALTLAEIKRGEAEDLLGFMVGEFADKLRSVQRMDLLDGINKKATEYFTEKKQVEGFLTLFTSKEQLFQSNFKQAQTLQAIAEVDYSRGKQEEALKGFNIVETQLLDLYKLKPNDQEVLKALGVNSFWQGQVYLNLNELEKVKYEIQQYLKYSQQLLALYPEDPYALLEVSYAQNALGTIALNEHKYHAAKLAFEDSISKKQSIFELAPNDIIVDLADSYSWLATSQFHLNENLNAINNLLTAQKLLEKYSKTDSNNANILDNEIPILKKILGATLYSNSNNDKKNLPALDVKRYTEQIITKSEQLLLQDSSNHEWQRLYAEAISFLLLNVSRAPAMSDQLESLTPHKNKVLELLKADPEISPDAYILFIAFYQSKEMWNESKSLLHTFESSSQPNLQTSSILEWKLSTVKATQYIHEKSLILATKECTSVLDTIPQKSQHYLIISIKKAAEECSLDSLKNAIH